MYFRVFKSLYMSSDAPSCSNGVDDRLTCSICSYPVVKNGRTSGGNQRYLCKECRSSKVCNPAPNGFGCKFNEQIIQFTKEGLGIRSTSRILGISPSTVIRKILDISDHIVVPELPIEPGRIQVDELYTFVQNKNKGIYVIYSWSQDLKQVLSLTVGSRSKSNLRLVINPLLAVEVETINTDHYSGYKGVVPQKKHTTFKRRNNGIERQNLNLRTHLKRLNKRTICFSKSVSMLESVLKIYWWV
jgi:insertion element IS1 protein InsB